MNFLMSMILFDKSVLIKKTEQKKIHSYLFVIGFILLTSLFVVVTKTIVFNEQQLQQNLQQIENIKQDQVIYTDGLNRIKIDKGNVFLNGDKLFSMESLEGDKDSFLTSFIDIKNSSGQLSFVLFIYQYLSSFKYLILFLILLIALSYTSRKQLEIIEDISSDLATTFTSYILVIPMLMSAVIRFLNFRFSFSILLLTMLSIILEYLFVKYYITEKGMNDEEKMVA